MKLNLNDLYNRTVSDLMDDGYQVTIDIPSLEQKLPESFGTLAPTVDLDAEPFIPEGWTLESHKKMGVIPLDMSKISLHLEPEQVDGVIRGRELEKRLASLSPLNANMLDYLLTNTHLIPEAWKGQRVFFWGTVYRSSDDNRYVRRLSWIDGQWHWRYRWFGRDFGGRNPAAILTP